MYMSDSAWLVVRYLILFVILILSMVWGDMWNDRRKARKAAVKKALGIGPSAAMPDEWMPAPLNMDEGYDEPVLYDRVIRGMTGPSGQQGVTTFTTAVPPR